MRLEKKKYSTVAFIPARKNSKRIKDKNIYSINGHPLMAYSIISALDSKCFDDVYLVTDDKKYSEIGKTYGAKIPFLRPKNISSSKSPDFEWVKFTLDFLRKKNKKYDIFSIIRPTNPLRSANYIQKAFDKFYKNKKIDSLRAVSLCKEHPGKMWKIDNGILIPLIKGTIKKVPYHSSQYAALPKIYTQNASLEIAWVESFYKTRSIAGKVIIPYISNEFEGFDINNYEDIIILEHYLKNKKAILPKIKKSLKKNIK